MRCFTILSCMMLWHGCYCEQTPRSLYPMHVAYAAAVRTKSLRHEPNSMLELAVGPNSLVIDGVAHNLDQNDMTHVHGRHYEVVDNDVKVRGLWVNTQQQQNEQLRRKPVRAIPQSVNIDTAAAARDILLVAMPTALGVVLVIVLLVSMVEGCARWQCGGLCRNHVLSKLDLMLLKHQSSSDMIR